MDEGNLRALEVVNIRWVDSETLTEWTELSGLKYESEMIETVGFLIHQDSDVYLIASTFDKTTDSINAAIWIPKSAVREVKSLGMVIVS